MISDQTHQVIALTTLLHNLSQLLLLLLYSVADIASFPGHSQILSHSHGEKLGEGLGRHGPEMVDSVSM